MKKTVVIAIGLIYMVAIIIVGLFGQKLKVDDPVIYATNIICESENYIEYTTDKEKIDNKADGEIKVDYEPNLKIVLNCRAQPDNVTNANLRYDMADTTLVTLVKNADYTAYLTVIKKPIDIISNIWVTVKSEDGKNATLKIKIKIIDISNI